MFFFYLKINVFNIYAFNSHSPTSSFDITALRSCALRNGYVILATLNTLTD